MSGRNKNEGGRPLKYLNNKELKELLIQYKREIGNRKISKSDLEKKYKIPRNIWTERKEIKELIEKYNQIDLGLDNLNILEYDIELLSDLEQLASDCGYGANERFMKGIRQHSDFEKGLISRCREYFKFSKKYSELEQKYAALEEINKTLREERDFYKNKYFSLGIGSKSKMIRDKEGIDKNVIQFDRKEINSDFEDFFDLDKE